MSVSKMLYRSLVMSSDRAVQCSSSTQIDSTQSEACKYMKKISRMKRSIHISMTKFKSKEVCSEPLEESSILGKRFRPYPKSLDPDQ